MVTELGGKKSENFFSVSWACLSLYPEFYKREYFPILKTSSTREKLKTSMDLADPKIMID